MSLNRFAVALFRLGVNDERKVVSAGVWQTLQPMELNRLRPLLMEVEPPGVVAFGVGGARRRMNIANATVSLSTPAPTPLKCVVSSGVALMRQAAGRPAACPSPGSERS